MKIQSVLRKFGVSTLMAAALMMVTADVTYAQRGGGGRGGGGRGGGNPGFSGGGRGYSGGRSFTQPRGNWGGRSFSAPRGNYGGGRSYYRGGRGFLPGNRGYYSNRFYPRGRSFFFFGAPLGGFYYRSYPVPYCNPNGYRDRWGRWYPDPRCAYDPYYGY